MNSVFSWQKTFESVFMARSSPQGLCNVNKMAGILFLKTPAHIPPTSSAEKNFADKITWITRKTEQNLEIWGFFNSRLEMWVWESGRKIHPAGCDPRTKSWWGIPLPIFNFGQNWSPKISISLKFPRKGCRDDQHHQKPWQKEGFWHQNDWVATLRLY